MGDLIDRRQNVVSPRRMFTSIGAHWLPGRLILAPMGAACVDYENYFCPLGKADIEDFLKPQANEDPERRRAR